ncbi:MAG: hypothetical protein OHK0056_03570 [Bacteriovoracaceae bacterium]
MSRGFESLVLRHFSFQKYLFKKTLNARLFNVKIKLDLSMKYKLALFVIIILTIIANFKIIKKDPLLIFDDQVVVSKIEKIKNFNDYYDQYKIGNIYDIQPIRDFTYFIDFTIKRNLNLSTHHAQNVFWWIICFYIFFKLLILQIKNEKLIIIVTSLYAFHPTIMNTVSWVAARKHLLSTAFILLATYFFLKNISKMTSRKNILFIIFLFLLSCLSQPINILWPIWVLYYAFENNELSDQVNKILYLKLLIPLFFILVIIGFSNYEYYATTFAQQAGFSKFTSGDTNSIGLKILLLSRYFIQALVPYWSTPTSYYQGSIVNLYGLIPMVGVGYIAYKNRSAKIFNWIIFSILPLLVVSLRATNVFGSDTYTPIFIAGIFIFFSKCIDNLNYNFTCRSKIIISLISILLVMAFFVKSTFNIHQWIEYKSLIDWAYRIEPSPQNLKEKISISLKEGRSIDAYKYSLRLIQWDRFGKDTDKLFGLSLLQVPNLKAEDRENTFKLEIAKNPNSAWLPYCLAHFYHANGQSTLACNILRDIDIEKFQQFEQSINLVLESYKSFCQKDDLSNLERIEIIREKMKFAIPK